MRPYRQVILLAFCSLLPTLSAGAATDQEVSLARVARTANMRYVWLPATRAVQLSGPGIVLVVRPGDNLYEVNDRIETTAATPLYASGDIYVSRTLANHILALARQAQTLESLREIPSARTEAIAAELHGTIAFTATQLQGAEALIVTGEAPPGAPVRITLLATLSSQLPNIVLSRHDLIAEPDGKFQAIVPIAPDYMRDSFIHVLATSSPGVNSASVQLLVHEPNLGINVPAEAQPGGIW